MGFMEVTKDKLRADSVRLDLAGVLADVALALDESCDDQIARHIDNVEDETGQAFDWSKTATRLGDAFKDFVREHLVDVLEDVYYQAFASDVVKLGKFLEVTSPTDGKETALCEASINVEKLWEVLEMYLGDGATECWDGVTLGTDYRLEDEKVWCVSLSLWALVENLNRRSIDTLYHAVVEKLYETDFLTGYIDYPQEAVEAYAKI